MNEGKGAASAGDAASTGAPATKLKKRAVVVVHGIGNQSPMTTLRGLVEAIWTGASELTNEGERPRTWAKRDLISDSFELRRITTNHDKSGRRTDFFEFYWADMMEDTQLASVIWWLRRLLFRPPGRVPPAVRGPWIAGILVVLLLVGALGALALLLLKALHTLTESFSGAVGWLALAAILAAVLWYLRHRVLVQVIGDAARYLTPDPQNIAARSRIRTAGMKLLAALHESPDYERVILVCHSLGTVIGYDLLNFYWGTVNECFAHKPGSCPAIERLEKSIGDLREAPDDLARLACFRDAQREYAREVCGLAIEEGGEKKVKWKVTDFITLGSPLTHAHFLMVDDNSRLLKSDMELTTTERRPAWSQPLDEVTRKVAALFLARAAQREFPLCPPVDEAENAFTYLDRVGNSVPHHAAVFAAVRWTNIFAPCRGVIFGDVIGGEVRSIFGPGVRDIALKGSIGRRLFAHTHYWDDVRPGAGPGDREHVDVLRAAVNLIDASEQLSDGVLAS